jgi:hypothetical protein
MVTREYYLPRLNAGSSRTAASATERSVLLAAAASRLPPPLAALASGTSQRRLGALVSVSTPEQLSAWSRG